MVANYTKYLQVINTMFLIVVGQQEIKLSRNKDICQWLEEFDSRFQIRYLKVQLIVVGQQKVNFSQNKDIRVWEISRLKSHKLLVGLDIFKCILLNSHLQFDNTIQQTTYKSLTYNRRWSKIKYKN